MRKNIGLRKDLICSCAVIGLLAATNAGLAASAAGSGADSDVQEIVVTANKRAERVQDVASSVGVISSAQLEDRKLEQLSDYVAFLPGVTANSTGTPGQSSLTIRGISPLSAGSKVATYIDETPLGSSGIWAQAGGLTLDLLPFDLDRVELLRGPQGTLYGASSMGGLLKYVLTTPDTKEIGEDVAVETAAIQNAGTVANTFEGHVNLPIIKDELAVSASGFYKYTPGYIDNVYTQQSDTNEVKQYGGRVAAFWQPVSNLTVKLNGLWQTNDSRDDSVETVINPTVTQASASSPKVVAGGTSLGDYKESEAFDQPFKDKVDFYSGTVDWDVGLFDIVSATSWSEYDVRRLANRSPSYGTYFPAFRVAAGLDLGATDLDTKKFTQELRLTSPRSDVISWQIGGFYTHEDQSNFQTQTAFTNAYTLIPAFAPQISYITIPTTYQEYAGFGDLTWTVTSDFDISGGVRYSENKQVFNISARGYLAGLAQEPLVSLNTIRSTQDDTTWMANARYHLTSDIMTYFRVATGYAPGGANTPYPGVPEPVVGSETLTSYEGGIKSEFFDHRAMIDLSAFHIDWRNIQLAARFGAIGYTANGGSAASDGFELASSFSPIRHLTVGFNAAYTDARLTSLNPNVATAFIVDQRLEDVPDWAVSGTVDYNWDLTTDWTARVGAAVRWVDSELGAQPAIGAPLFTLPAYTIADVTGSVTDGRYTIGLFVKNISDSKAYSAGYPYVGVTGGIKQIDYYVMQPRTIGLNVMAKF